MRVLYLIFLFVSFALPVLALDVPKTSDFVTDTAGILSSDAKKRLNTLLKEFENSDSTQIVVLTVPSLEGEVLEEYGLRVLETWGVGQKDTDNGAVLLIAKKERKIRIEVGYGLEGRLTDLVAGRIIDNEITPHFKNGDFDGGVERGIGAMIAAVRGEYTSSASQSRGDDFDPFGFLFLAIMILIWGKTAFNRGRGNSGFYIGGSSSSSGGFGGGFSGGFSGGGGGGGGGGASGGW